VTEAARPSGRSIVELLAGVALLAAGQGAAGTLVAMRLGVPGSAVAAGLVGSAYFAGLLVGTLRAGRLVERVGAIRAFSAAAAGLAVALAGLTAWEGPLAWAACRGVAGFSMSIVYGTTENWLASRSSPSNRGRTLAAYTVTLYSALACGQLLVSFPESEGDARRLAFAAMLAAAGVVPVALTRESAPSWPDARGLDLRSLARAAPVGLVAAVGAGAMCGALVSLGPVVVRRAGLGDSAVAAFMTAVWGGGLLVQIPIGRASDRWGRRPVLAVAGFLSAVGFVLLAALSHAGRGALLVPVTALAAGLAFTFYPLGAAYTLDRVPRESMTAANRALLLSYAIGSCVGPIVASLLIRASEPPFLFLFVAAIAGSTALFSLVRLQIVAPIAAELRSRVLLVPRTSLIGSALDPRTERGGSQ
jgi:MFS family permease